jgi:hypothetical protein
MVPRAKQVMKQTRARILRGDMRSEGKIFGLFEPSTEIIRKGKVAKPNEFGKMVNWSKIDANKITMLAIAAAAVVAPVFAQESTMSLGEGEAVLISPNGSVHKSSAKVSDAKHESALAKGAKEISRGTVFYRYGGKLYGVELRRSGYRRLGAGISRYGKHVLTPLGGQKGNNPKLTYSCDPSNSEELIYHGIEARSFGGDSRNYGSRWRDHGNGGTAEESDLVRQSG